MRLARVLFRNEEAGVLMQRDDGTFVFRYTDAWLANPNKPAISLTLPKNKKEFQSQNLFPYFYHMLPEGHNRDLMCRLYRIDENDHLGLLLTAARVDAIGAVRLIRQ